MNKSDPKKFYNEVMPGKFGDDYEHSRWKKTPILRAQYEATKKAIESKLLTQESLRPIRVCELGPGAGTWTTLLLQRFPDAEFTLVDISKEMLERVQAVVQGARIELVESDILDFTDTRQFDVFFSSRVLEYVENKKAFAEKVDELLTHGGTGFIITKMPHYERDKLLGRKASRFHLGQIMPQALSGLLEEAGLRVNGVYPVTMSFPVFQSAFLNRLLARYFNDKPLNSLSAFFAESYCVLLQKP